MRWAVLYGVFGFGVNFPLLYLGEARIPSGIAGVIFGTSPLTTALLARAFGLERLDRSRIAGALIALAGVGVIFWNRLGGTVPLAPMIGVLVGSIGAALGGIMLKKGGRLPVVGANAAGTATGFVICLAVSFIAGEAHPWPSAWDQIYPIVYLTLAASLGAYLMLAWLIKVWDVTSTSFISVFVPVLALALGAVVRGERFGLYSISGAVLVVTGVIVGLGTEHRKRVEAVPEPS